MIECDTMKNKGQALVEFILILPIFILIIITMVDFGNILLKEYSLESDLDTIANMYKNIDTDKINSYISENEIRVTYDRDGKYLKISLYKNVDLLSPVLITIIPTSTLRRRMPAAERPVCTGIFRPLRPMPATSMRCCLPSTPTCMRLAISLFPSLLKPRPLHPPGRCLSWV